MKVEVKAAEASLVQSLKTEAMSKLVRQRTKLVKGLI